MAEEMHKTIPELIHSIEKKDRRFRLAQTVFMLAIMAAIGFAVYFIYQGYAKEQQRRIEAVAQINKNIENKIDDANKRLQCVTNFFAQPDRANLILTDPNECFTQRLDSGDIRKLETNPGPDNSTQNNNTNGITSQEGNTNNSASDQTFNPNMDGLEQVTPPDSGSGSGQKPPRKLFGIPVCVPFTDFCAR